ncbi:hypothetical protein, partial [Escherichia coli]|uniref:hypothetical protein n=1 Tax=Escherichia coli TaxID=562 RepID=UPI00202BB246
MGKGSSKGHTPREAKDNLKSTQLLSVIDAISEGPVEGPVDGLKSVLLNSTPVLDTEGNTNISGVTVVFRAGEQEQTPPEDSNPSGGVCSCSPARNTTVTPEMLVFPSV